MPPKSNGDPSAWNRYNYTTGDPVNGDDPSGLLTLVIDGAFDDSPDWLQAGSSFLNEVEATFGETPTGFRWPGLGVTALSGYVGIIAAGFDLVNYLNNAYEFQPGEQLNIVAFSDGGNVVKIAAAVGIHHTINNLVTLGTPQNFDLPSLNTNGVQNYCNVSSLADFVQFGGASPTQIYYTTAYFIYSQQDYAAAFEAFLNGDIELGLEYTAAATAEYAASTAWFLSTKLDPIANHNVTLLSESHFDLHTADVWNRVKGACGLPQ